MTRDDHWFEIWFTEGSEVLPTYLLIVAADNANWAGIRVVDPLKRNEVVFVGSTYEEVCMFLWEDEYEQIEGRVFPDHEWY